MERMTFSFPFTLIQETELSEPDSALIAAARRACLTAYAPYSRFHVGAARLAGKWKKLSAGVIRKTLRSRWVPVRNDARYITPMPASPALRSGRWPLRRARTTESLFQPPSRPAVLAGKRSLRSNKNNASLCACCFTAAEKIYCIEKAADLLPLHFGANTLDGQ